jgi:hypothetical protein
MKKLILLSFLVFGLVSFSTNTLEKSKNRHSVKKIETIDNVDCKHGQCQATAKSTCKHCKHCVSEKSDLYCW